MSTHSHRPTARFRWIARTSCLLAAALAVMASVAGGWKNKLTCGKPTKSGKITVTLVVQHGSDIRYVPVTTEIDTSVCHTGEDKAGFIRAEFWSSIARRDTVKALGTTALIDFQAEPGFRVNAVALGPDSTYEPDEVSLGVPVNDQYALCSLAGTASGRDQQGRAGYVRLRVAATNVIVPTQQGMPSQVVEQMLVQRMNQLGIPARFAMDSDFANGYEGLHHDPQVIWFQPADTTGFLEQIGDPGLSLDLAAMLNGNLQAPTDVPDDTGPPEAWLDVFPSVFARGSVSVRYSTRGGGGARLDVFDATGRRVRTLLEGGGSGAGAVGSLAWDGRDGRNAPLPAGVYFVRLSTSRESFVRRVVRVR